MTLGKILIQSLRSSPCKPEGTKLGSERTVVVNLDNVSLFFCVGYEV